MAQHFEEKGMALKIPLIRSILPFQLTQYLRDPERKVRIIDCRSFLEFNDNHIVGAINICCSKLIKRRLQQDKITLKDLLTQCRIELEETSDLVLYDQRTTVSEDMIPDTFIHVLVQKLSQVFDAVSVLHGGFVGFHSAYPELCENRTWKFPGLTALSQPCLPTVSSGPTRILPFLYLGSEEDAHNKELLKSHNITYELNVSNKCPKPDFIPEGHFMRIPVNDSNNEKLVPYFYQTFQFIEKVRETNECALVHCLAGISRSPTVAIAYVMRHLGMTCEEAYRYVKSKRATISPNFNFLGQLLEYEQQLISEKILTNKVTSHTSGPPPTQNVSADYFVGGQAVFTSPTTLLSSKTAGRRLNLSLRITPYTTSTDPTSPKDASPTTAMARLQFDKPYGKENRTNVAGTSSAAFASSSIGGLGFSAPRPTRLVMEQNVTSIKEEEISGQWESMTKSLTKQSISMSISTGIKSRKSSFDQMSSSVCESRESKSRMDYSESGVESEDNLSSSTGMNKKYRIHKFTVEQDPENAEAAKLSPPCEVGAGGTVPSYTWPNLSVCASSDIPSMQSSLVCPTNRDYLRSDSVSTSGIGSEFSDQDLAASGCWEGSELSNTQDDGVFSDTCQLSAKPSSSTRQLQLWSSDSGHWSSADEGLCSSCNSSAAEVPSLDTKSPEKRKFREPSFPNPAEYLTSREKRRSYAGNSNPEWSLGSSLRPKRWSLAEDSKERTRDCLEDSSEQGAHAYKDSMYREEIAKDSDNDTSSGSTSCSLSSDLDLSHRWFNLLTARALPCCSTRGHGLYRVQSCPSSISGPNDPHQSFNTVPESPPEPISDSALLKWRACHNRNQIIGASEHLGSGSRECCGSLNSDDLWRKLRKIHDTKRNESHSSSSTLASSSFSIVVQ